MHICNFFTNTLFMDFETQAIRTQVNHEQNREHSVPIFMTSSFTFENAEEARAMFADEVSGDIYSRYSNPNNSEFIAKLCAMEKAEDGLATATGMAAMFTSMAGLLKHGDHVLASRAVFGSTHQLFTSIFPKWGITHTYFDRNDMGTLESLIQPNTKMIFAESPSNPGLEIIDLKRLGEVAKEYQLIFNVDNCFATPYLQNPIEFGADIVTHSATKFMDGQGRSLGGAIVGKKALIDEIRFFYRHTGPSLSPFNAWLLSKSLETLAIRMDRHCANALAISKHFEGHQELENVKYPFLESHPQHALAKQQMKLGGGLITLTVHGGVSRAVRFMDQLQMISLTPNLGDSRTIATHPTTTTHSKLSEDERNRVGITPGLVRIAVGLENVTDIITDITQALEQSK